jgi:hypothetical protein
LEFEASSRENSKTGMLTKRRQTRLIAPVLFADVLIFSRSASRSLQTTDLRESTTVTIDDEPRDLLGELIDQRLRRTK